MTKKEIIDDMKAKGEKHRKIILKRANGSKSVSTINLEPSLTDQQWKDDSDPNHIIEKYKRTGQLTYVNKIQGKFADVTSIQDLHSGILSVQKAKDDFLHLSSDIRSRFNNSVIELVQFLNNPANEAEAIELGLIAKKKPIVPVGGPSVQSNTETVQPVEASKESAPTNPNGN